LNQKLKEVFHLQEPSTVGKLPGIDDHSPVNRNRQPTKSIKQEKQLQMNGSVNQVGQGGRATGLELQ